MEKEVIELKISNIVMHGKLPFKHKPRESELRHLINNSNLFWNLTNEEITPLLTIYFEKTYVSVLSSGAVHMAGLKSIEDGHKYCSIILHELKEHCPRLFKD